MSLKRLFTLSIILFFGATFNLNCKNYSKKITKPVAGHCQVWIFDFGNVLYETLKSAAFRLIAWPAAQSWAAGNGDPFKEGEKRSLEFLDLIHPRNPDEWQVYTNRGNLYPQLLCDLHAGKISLQELAAIVKDGIKKHESFFRNKAEKNFIQAIIELMIDPNVLIKTQGMNKDILQFIKHIKTLGHKVYAISNWDKESSPLLIGRDNLYAYFDDIIISGDVGMIKPNPAIFQHLIDKYDLNPYDCFFVDDRPENVEAANSLEIYGILYDNAKNKIKELYTIFTAASKNNSLVSKITAEFGLPSKN